MLKKLSILLLVIVMMMPMLSVHTISADEQSIGNYGTSIDNAEYFDFNLNTYDVNRSNIPSSRQIGEGQTFTAYYPDAFTYLNGNKYSMKVDIKYLGENKYIEAGNYSVLSGSVKGVGLTSEKEIDIGAFGLNYDITFSFYSKNTFADADKVNIYGAIVLDDPDQANYLFDGANKRKIYYKDVKNLVTDRFPEADKFNLKDYYNVTSSGIIHKDSSDTEFISWPNFNEGKFAVSINNESSFHFVIEGKQENIRLTAGIMKIYPITYVLNGGTNDSSNPSSYTTDTATITIKNPTRSGWDFEGWTSTSRNIGIPTKNPTIPKGSTGEQDFTALWSRQKAIIKFIDKTNSNEVLEEKNVEGTKNSLISSVYTTKTVDIKYWTDRGYSLASDGFSSSPKFDTISDNVQEVLIVLEHTYTTVDKSTHNPDECLNSACTVKQTNCVEY